MALFAASAIYFEFKPSTPTFHLLDLILQIYLELLPFLKHKVCFSQIFRHCASKSSDNRMIFSCYYSTCLGNCLSIENCLKVYCAYRLQLLRTFTCNLGGFQQMEVASDNRNIRSCLLTIPFFSSSYHHTNWSFIAVLVYDGDFLSTNCFVNILVETSSAGCITITFGSVL